MDSAKDPLRRLKISITLIALFALLVRIAFPELKIDAVSLGLIALALVPWLSPLIKSVELPGGAKIEFQDVKDAAERVTSSEPAPSYALQVPEPSYMAIADQDPRLAMVGLRIEIEKRLRALAQREGLNPKRPLGQLLGELEEREVLHGSSASGLRDLVALGNQAAHGADVSREVAYSAVEFGPGVLRVLDDKLGNSAAP